jgi:hypothetical protein
MQAGVNIFETRRPLIALSVFFDKSLITYQSNRCAQWIAQFAIGVDFLNMRCTCMEYTATGQILIHFTKRTQLDEI